MGKRFNEIDINLLNRGQEIRSEDLAAVLGRPTNAVRVKLSRTGKAFDPEILKRNQSLRCISVKKSEGKVTVSVGEIIGTLKIIFI